MNRKHVVSLLVATALVLSVISGVVIVRRWLQDASCSDAGQRVQPQLLTEMQQIKGSTDHRWVNERCQDGGMALLRFVYPEPPTRFGAVARARGCELKEEKAATWICHTGSVTYEMAANPNLDGPGSNVLVRVTNA